MGTWFDIRLALRSLRRQPGFALIAVLTLALGIGANSAIFSVINYALLSKPPYPEPDRIAMLRIFDPAQDKEGSAGTLAWSYRYFVDLRAHNVPALEQVAALWPWHVNLTGTEVPERLDVEMVSAQYFPLLGVKPLYGRTFLPEEDAAPGGQPVALIGHALWRRSFGADPNVVGKSVNLEGRPLVVVGVMPPGFRGLTGKADAWIPMEMAPTLTFPRRLERRTSHFHQVVARLRRGVTPAQADAELAGFLTQLHKEQPPPDPSYELIKIHAVPLQKDRIEPSFSRALYVLFAAVGLVFLIACVNVVNLLLVRTAARHRETAVRVAMGASRFRLMQVFLAESVVLGLLGGLAGLFVAQMGVRLVRAYLPVEVRDTVQLGSFRMGADIFALTLLLALLTGLLLGLLPAIQASRGSVTSWLKEGVSGLSGRLRFNPMSLLVISEIALSLVLLIGAGLMLRSFAQLWGTRLGFDPDNVITVRTSHTFQEELGPERMAFYQQMLQRVGALPGVESASLTNWLPVSLMGGEAGSLSVDGKAYPESFEATVGVHMISSGYFDTLRIPALRGRKFTDQDRQGSPRVAILNETAARHFFPGENPLGKRIRPSIGWEEGEFAEVVGVVGDVKYGKVEEAPQPTLYIPFLQNPYPEVFLLVRTSLPEEALLPTIQKTVLEMDPNLPLYDAKTMRFRLGETLSKFRFSTLLLTIFAVLACVLAAIGLYGVIAYSISKRTSEIGIRLALGAQRGAVFTMILRDALSLAVLGLVLGLGLALASTRLLASFLYQLSTVDTATFVGVTMLLLIVSLVAAYFPARRALAVEPRTALRSE